MKGILLAFLLLSFALPGEAQRVTLVRNGKSDWVILLAPGSTPPMRHGAEEIQRHLQLMSGAQLPIVQQETGTTAWPKSARGAIVIAEDRILAGREHRARLPAEGFRIRTLTPHGSRDIPRIEISGDNQRGALYGCYALLEDVLGCHWFTAKVARIPHHKTLTLGPLNIRQQPAFEYREPYYTEAFDRDWAVRNRTNGNSQHLDATVGGKVAYGKFVHTFNELVPPDQYFDTHPEYFSLINGKRMKGYYQLCLTNPDVLRLSIEKVRAWIRENPTATIFSVSQNDTYNNCQCENCKAVEREEGAPSGPLLRFVNAVAEAIAPESPHVLIDTLAYQWSEDPPKHVRPRRNVRIRLAPIGACFGHGIDACDPNKHVFANLSAWAKITNQLYIWHYSTNFANYLQPLPDLDEIAADIPLFKKHGVVGLFYEGCYAPGGGGEMSELKAYLMAKLMWNPARPAQPIITEFLQGVYGKGASSIQQWLDLLHAEVRAKKVHPRIYDPPTVAYLSSDTLTKGAALFDRALKDTASDPVAHEQVEHAQLALEYVQLMRAAPGTPERAALAKTVSDKLHRYGIGQVREGEPVEKFLQRVGQ